VQLRKEGSSKACSLGDSPQQAQEKELMTNTGRSTSRGKGLFALAISAMLATLASSVQADTLTFDPTGTAGSAGDITGVTVLGFAPASVLADDIGNALTPTNPYRVFYQSEFVSVSNAAGTVRATGGNPFVPSSNTFTVVAGFLENATPNGSGGLNFTLANPGVFSTSPTAPNFFRIYQQPGTNNNPNNTTGTGYATGTVVLEGVIVPTPGVNPIGTFTPTGTGQFTSTPNPNLTPPAATSPGFQSILGNGSTSLSVFVLSAPNNFFPTPISVLNFTTFNALPFGSQQPAGSFFNGTGQVIPNLDAFNGSGPDLEFRSSASATIGTVIPEPAAILQGLTAAGMLSSLVFLKRRQTKPTVA